VIAQKMIAGVVEAQMNAKTRSFFDQGDFGSSLYRINGV